MEDNGEPILVEAKWLQEMAIRLEREEKDGRKLLKSSLPTLTEAQINKIVTRKAVLTGDSIKGIHYEEVSK